MISSRNLYILKIYLKNVDTSKIVICWGCKWQR